MHPGDPLLTMNEAEDMMLKWREAIDKKIPYSFLRMGDREIAVCAQEVLTFDLISKHYRWIGNPKFIGVPLPNIELKDQLVAAYRGANAMGILVQANWYFYPLSQLLISYYGFRPEDFVYAFANAYISKKKMFYKLFRSDRILLVGSKSDQFKEVLENRYRFKNIVGTVPVRGFPDVPNVKSQMQNIDFDIAIISAGVSGKILADYAKNLGRVGIDYGSGADTAIQAHQEGLSAWKLEGFAKHYSGF